MSQYKKLSIELSNLRKEYKDKTLQCESLKSRIVEIDKILKRADMLRGQWTTPGGNYTPSYVGRYKTLDESITEARSVFKDCIVLFGKSLKIDKLTEWLNNKLKRLKKPSTDK